MFAVDTLDSREVPVRGGGVFNERCLLFGDGFVVTEVFLEHSHKVFGIFDRNEELLGGGSVLKTVETAVGRRRIECGCCC